jgi:uncharacterized protein YndB with AHSA1/START domain
MNTIRSAAVLVLIALLATACSGGDDDTAAPETTLAPESTTTTSTTTSTTSTTTTTTTSTTTTTTTTTAAPEGTDEEQIEALIEEYWRTVFLVGFNPPDPREEVWEAVATPDLRPALAANAQTDLDNGVGIEGENPDEPFVHSSQITISGQFAIVFMCLRDEGRSYDLSTGETIEEISIITLKRMEAVSGADGWLVSDSESLERFAEEEVDLCSAAFPS